MHLGTKIVQNVFCSNVSVFYMCGLLIFQRVLYANGAIQIYYYYYYYYAVPLLQCLV